jgi:hypothetical protein
VKKAHSLGGVTLYPSADVEIYATGGVIDLADYTRYPHPETLQPSPQGGGGLQRLIPNHMRLLCLKEKRRAYKSCA